MKDSYALTNGHVLTRNQITVAYLQVLDRDPIKNLVYALRADLVWQGYPSGTDIVRFTKAELIKYACAMAQGATSYAAVHGAQSAPQPISDPDTLPDYQGESNQPEIDPDEELDAESESESESDVVSDLRDVLSRIGLKTDASVKPAQLDAVLDAAKAHADIADAVLKAQLEELKRKLAENVTTLRIERVDLPTMQINGPRHEGFDDLVADALAFQAAGRIDKANFCLTGPAGTGKTTAIEKIAELLGLPFYFNGSIDSEYKLRGFIDAHGRVMYTPFRTAYETGGVYLFDEMDSSMPSACLAFNAALANGQYDFPDPNGIKPIKRHNTCFIFAATNTWGGPEGNYVGRMRQDGAFLDRFIRVPWVTDEKFERALCTNQSWCDYVQGVRARLIKEGIEHIVSPRATFNGEILLAAGRPWPRVVDICVRKGLNTEDWNKVKGDAI